MYLCDTLTCPSPSAAFFFLHRALLHASASPRPTASPHQTDAPHPHLPTSASPHQADAPRPTRLTHLIPPPHLGLTPPG